MLTRDGGKPKQKDVMNYKPPYGPEGITDKKTPGIHGNVYPSGSQSAATQGHECGYAGIGGKNHGNKGSQR